MKRFAGVIRVLCWVIVAIAASGLAWEARAYLRAHAEPAQVGRYSVQQLELPFVIGRGGKDAVLLDSVTGRTWRLGWYKSEDTETPIRSTWIEVAYPSDLWYLDIKDSAAARRWMNAPPPDAGTPPR